MTRRSAALAQSVKRFPLATNAEGVWQHAFGDVTPSAALAFQSIGVAYAGNLASTAQDHPVKRMFSWKF